MRTLALLLLSAAATGTDSHALRSAADVPSRRLQNNNGVDIVEYCGQCIWRGRIVCEARAQFLVREYGDMTLEEARISILDECTADGSDKVTISLDAFCGDCPWQAMNFNCDARVAYLMQTYQLSEEQAQQATVEKAECIDPEYVPEELREPEDSDSGGGLSGGAIAGIVIGLLLLLLCCLGGWYVYYRKWYSEEEKEKKVDEEAVPVAAAVPEAAPVPVPVKKSNRSSKGVSFGLRAPDPDGDTRNIATDDYHAGDSPKKTKFAGADEKFPKTAAVADDGDDADEDSGDSSPSDDAGESPESAAVEGSETAETPTETADEAPEEENVDQMPDDGADAAKVTTLEP
ncbi:hypothetical protein ACHAXT_002077 [Thalassiosira profunda]